MKIEISFSSKIIVFRFYPDKYDEELFIKDIHLLARGCFFEIPFVAKPIKIHPDLLALSALLLCYPFTSKYFELDFPVSEEFAELCKKNLAIEVCSRSDEIKPRRILGGIPALAYSGGVDSSAALALMPKEKIVYFLDRVQPHGKKSLYNKTAALTTFEEVKKAEVNAHIIQTDMEYLRSKVGFPVDQLNVDVPHPVSIPALLMADEFGIDAIAYGVVMESVYMIGHENYEDYSTSSHYLKWTPFYELVSCSLFLPTAGITEVGTTVVTEKTRFSNYIRSCMRGDENKACGKCIKCLRKNLLIKSVKREAVEISDLEDNLDSAEVINNIYGIIYQHENVYRYIAQFLPANKFTLLLTKRIFIASEDCRWMEKWFQESIDLVPVKYRIDFLKKIFIFFEPMSYSDVSFVKAWDASKQRNGNAEAMDKWQNYIYNTVSTHVKKHIDKTFPKQRNIIS